MTSLATCLKKNSVPNCGGKHPVGRTVCLHAIACCRIFPTHKQSENNGIRHFGEHPSKKTIGGNDKNSENQLGLSEWTHKINKTWRCLAAKCGPIQDPPPEIFRSLMERGWAEQLGGGHQNTLNKPHPKTPLFERKTLQRKMTNSRTTMG